MNKNLKLGTMYSTTIHYHKFNWSSKQCCFQGMKSLEGSIAPQKRRRMERTNNV